MARALGSGSSDKQGIAFFLSRDDQSDTGKGCAMKKSMIDHPAVWAFSTAAASLLAGAIAIVLADFGAPMWVFIALGLWLWTIGLPVTLAVLLTALLWGRIPGLTTASLGAFMACATILAFGVQTAFFLLISRILARRR